MDFDDLMWQCVLADCNKCTTRTGQLQKSKLETGVMTRETLYFLLNFAINLKPL